MSPFAHSSANSPERTREVGAEGPEDHGKVPAFLPQVRQQLEEGGQDPVVEAPVLAAHTQLWVRLGGDRLRVSRAAPGPGGRTWGACLEAAGPEQQLQVLLQEGPEAAARSRGEAPHTAKLGVVGDGAGARGQQGGGVAEPLPPAWRHTQGRRGGGVGMATVTQRNTGLQRLCRREPRDHGRHRLVPAGLVPAGPVPLCRSGRKGTSKPRAQTLSLYLMALLNHS